MYVMSESNLSKKPLYLFEIASLLFSQVNLFLYLNADAIDWIDDPREDGQIKSNWKKKKEEANYVRARRLVPEWGPGPIVSNTNSKYNYYYNEVAWVMNLIFAYNFRLNISTIILVSFPIRCWDQHWNLNSHKLSQGRLLVWLWSMFKWLVLGMGNHKVTQFCLVIVKMNSCFSWWM